MLDLPAEGVDGVELLLRAQAAVKVQPDLLAVEVAVEVDEKRLDGDGVAVADGGWRSALRRRS